MLAKGESPFPAGKNSGSLLPGPLRNPKILLLDDALSAVDTKTENTILNSMKRIMEGRTTVIIGHRVSSARLADKVIVLDDGRIIEEGDNESLIAANGAYKEMYDKQLKSGELVEES